MVVASDAVIVDADTVEVETLLSIYTVRQLRNFEQATRIAQGGVVVPHVNGITLGCGLECVHVVVTVLVEVVHELVG